MIEMLDMLITVLRWFYELEKLKSIIELQNNGIDTINIKYFVKITGQSTNSIINFVWGPKSILKLFNLHVNPDYISSLD
jgi:hypothetical protein